MDPVVLCALQELTSAVNPEYGLVHPADTTRTVSTFEVLRASGYRWDPAEVRRWAKQSTRLHPRTLDALCAYARGVADGRRYQLGPRTVRVGPGALRRWRQDYPTSARARSLLTAPQSR
jgi:hypothetical protein